MLDYAYVNVDYVKVGYLHEWSCMFKNKNKDLNILMFKSNQDHQSHDPWTLLQSKIKLQHVCDFCRN